MKCETERFEPITSINNFVDFSQDSPRLARIRYWLARAMSQSNPNACITLEGAKKAWTMLGGLKLGWVLIPQINDRLRIGKTRLTPHRVYLQLNGLNHAVI